MESSSNTTRAALARTVNLTRARGNRDECTQQARTITSRAARDTTSKEGAQPNSAKARTGHWEADDRQSPGGNWHKT